MKNKTQSNLAEFGDLCPRASSLPTDIMKNVFKGGREYFLGADHLASLTRPSLSLFSEVAGDRYRFGEHPHLTNHELVHMATTVASSYAALNALTTKKRAELGRAIAAKLGDSQTAQVLATTLMIETGKLFKDCLQEMDRTRQFIEDFCQILEKKPDLERRDGHEVRFVGKGLGIHFGPTNYPINEGVTIFLVRLLAGNPMLWKPTSASMATAHCFEQLVIKPAFREYQAKEPSFPSHCLGIVYAGGTQATEVLAPYIKHITFIGSLAAKNSIWSLLHETKGTEDRVFAASTMNPYIVLNSATIDASLIEQLVTASYSNRGERCTAPGIMFLPQSKSEVAIKLLQERLSKMRCGYPWESQTDISSPSEGTTKNEAVLKEVMTGVYDHSLKLLYPRLHEFRVEQGVLPPMLVQLRDLSGEAARHEPFGIVTKIYVYDDADPAWSKHIMSYLQKINRGQQLVVFGERREAEALAISFQEMTCGIFINVAGGRGPDFLPFEHSGESGVGTLSGYDLMYDQAVKHLRVTIK